MPISQDDITTLIRYINRKIRKQGVSFIMTHHFSLDRLNDIRNRPPIELEEIKSILERVIELHLAEIAALPAYATFNIKCESSHINMPCGIEKSSSASGGSLTKSIIITIMRKQRFIAKDPVEFIV